MQPGPVREDHDRHRDLLHLQLAVLRPHGDHLEEPEGQVHLQTQSSRILHQDLVGDPDRSPGRSDPQFGGLHIPSGGPLLIDAGSNLPFDNRPRDHLRGAGSGPLELETVQKPLPHPVRIGGFRDGDVRQHRRDNRVMRQIKWSGGFLYRLCRESPLQDYGVMRRISFHGAVV